MLNICVTNLRKYNEGELISEWIRLPTSEEAIQEVLDKIGINEECEEHFLSDWEWSSEDEHEEDIEIEGFPIKDFSEVFSLNQRLEDFLCDVYFEDIYIFNGIYNKIGDFEKSISKYKDGDYSIIYNVKSLSDLGVAALHDLNSFGPIPEDLEEYIDFERIGKEYLSEYSFIGRDRAIAVY